MLENVLQSVTQLLNNTILIVDNYGNVLEFLSDVSKSNFNKKINVQNIRDLYNNENYQKVLDFINETINQNKTNEIEILSNNDVKHLKCIPLKYNVVLLSVSDISDNDNITRLPNKKFFKEKLNAAIHRCIRSKMKGTLLFMSLNNYKSIVNNIGDDAGDKYIKTVSGILKKEFRPEDIIVRYGNKEFGIILENIKEVEDIAIILDKIKANLGAPIQIDNYEMETDFSIGISVFPEEDSNSPEELIKYASSALTHAKKLGKEYQFFTQDIGKVTNEYFEIEVRLQKALKNHEFYIQYQPQFTTNDSKAVAVEALLRWKNKDLGLIPPDTFIPIAEKSGMIHILGEWILKQVCMQIRRWQRKSINLMVAVNLSRKQLQNENIAIIIKKIIDRYQVSAENLEFEVTESAIIDDPEVAFRNIKKIRELGIKVSIDDFGTGYSSLANLKTFALDKLKIDKSFVDDLAKNDNGETIIKATIALAKSLGLKVVAEGVETNEQLAFLKEHECDEIQGFLFSKPVNPSQIEEIFSKTQED
jgi:diguanylate cyclase (GGDEF)-like protein